jgi:hypothetical protein
MTYSMAYGYRWFMNVYDILLPPTYHWEIFRIQLVEVRKRTMFWHVLAKILWGYSLKFRPEKHGKYRKN